RWRSPLASCRRSGPSVANKLIIPELARRFSSKGQMAIQGGASFDWSKADWYPESPTCDYAELAGDGKTGKSGAMSGGGSGRLAEWAGSEPQHVSVGIRRKLNA